MPKECSCSWNNDLAHKIFEENVEKVGKSKALQLLRNDIQSWIRERDGKQFDWTLRVVQDQLVSDTNDKSITGMIEDSMYGPHSTSVAQNVRANAPLELAVAREVTLRAVKGEDRIVFPEYFQTESGTTVVRFFSVLTKDKDDPHIYHGSRIDLEKDTTVREALAKVGETVVVAPLRDVARKQEPIQPKYSSAHSLVSEIPQGVAHVVFGTASEITYTARSVQRYFERRKPETKKRKSKTQKKNIGETMKRFVRQGKEKIQKVVLRPQTPVITEGSNITRHKKTVEGIQIEKSIARHERRMDKVRRKTEKKRRRVLPGGKQIHVRAERKTKQPTAQRQEKIMYKRHTLAHGESSHDRKEKRKKTDSEKTVIGLIRLMKHHIYKKELKKPLMTETPTQPKRFAEKQQRVHKYVADVSVAIIFWALVTPQKALRHEQVIESQIKQSQTQELKPNASTPWLLLAIIWHLAMIREAGYAKAHPKQKKVKKHTVYPLLAPRGVIFAYAT